MKSVLKYVFLFFTAFLIAGAIAYYSLRLFTQSADEVILPKLTGKNIIYVLETLTNLGLNAKLYGTQYDDSIPKYSVITQDPAPGSTIKKGRDIIIYISKGAKENIIPDLRQVPLNQALLILEKNEFKKGPVSFTYSPHTKKNSIIAQYPEAFTTTLKGFPCKLLVSRGADQTGIVMPELKGLQLENASLLIKDYHLGITKITSDIDRNQNKGIVLSFSPEAGSYVTDTTPISIVVNDFQKNKRMSPKKLSGIIFVTHSLSPGLLKRHVRVETDMFGPIINLYNEFMKPGSEVKILVPTQLKTNISIFIDHRLEKTIIFDPWKEDSDTGEFLLWESSPLQFYHQISPDLVKN